MDYVDPGVARAVSYEYLNQQLVWRELSGQWRFGDGPTPMGVVAHWVPESAHASYSLRFSQNWLLPLCPSSTDARRWPCGASCSRRPCRPSWPKAEGCCVARRGPRARQERLTEALGRLGTQRRGRRRGGVMEGPSDARQPEWRCQRGARGPPVKVAKGPLRLIPRAAWCCDCAPRAGRHTWATGPGQTGRPNRWGGPATHRTWRMQETRGGSMQISNFPLGVNLRTQRWRHWGLGRRSNAPSASGETSRCRSRYRPAAALYSPVKRSATVLRWCDDARAPLPRRRSHAATSSAMCASSPSARRTRGTAAPGAAGAWRSSQGGAGTRGNGPKRHSSADTLPNA